MWVDTNYFAGYGVGSSKVKGYTYDDKQLSAYAFDPKLLEGFMSQINSAIESWPKSPEGHDKEIA